MKIPLKMDLGIGQKHYVWLAALLDGEKGGVTGRKASRAE